jgi:hypothetical protein
LNTVGVVLIVAGVIFLIYSIICKNKVNVYNRRDNLIVVNKHKFLKLQLYLSILNSVCIITLGLVVIIYNLESAYIVLFPLFFHFMNYLIRLIGRSKQYIKYK